MMVDRGAAAAMRGRAAHRAPRTRATTADGVRRAQMASAGSRRAELHRFDRMAHVAVRGHQHDDRGRILRPHAREHGQPVEARHAQVERDRVEAPAQDARDRGLAVVRGLHVVGQALQAARQEVPHRLFVIDDENGALLLPGDCWRGVATGLVERLRHARTNYPAGRARAGRNRTGFGWGGGLCSALVPRCRMDATPSRSACERNAQRECRSAAQLAFGGQGSTVRLGDAKRHG